MNYNFINKINGWIVFAIATIVYLLTIEDTVSLWDCGEYITAAYKLEVGHPPGAPLYMIFGRVFSFFAAPENVAFYINALSALSSSFTILFMFWSITMLLKKLILQGKNELENHDKIGIFVAATIGSLAYTFTDSFWFSAVEGEVYAMASLFTAVIFWAILKWDEEMAALQANRLDSDVTPNRWLLLILFLLGLAIGVHLLGILVIPAIGYVIYFRVKETTRNGFFIAGILSIIILGFIQEGIIPGTISMASSFEIAFVNSIGLPFYSGSIFFFALLIFLCIYGVKYARKNNKTLLANGLMGLIFLLIGYGSFAVIVIRSNANTPLDENDPESLVTLHSYLKREQYGASPILFGPYWNSKEEGGEFNIEKSDRNNNGKIDTLWNLTTKESWEEASPYFLRRWVVSNDEKDLNKFIEKSDAEKWMSQQGDDYLTLSEKYFEMNESFRKNQGKKPKYESGQETFFPRMFASNKKDEYTYWSGYTGENVGLDGGKDKQRLPTFGENLSYFFNYQLNWMYFRYFMWNFAGRQNDIQGHGNSMNGNWISGIPFIDNPRLGDQSNAPFFTTENKANNKFYLIPLIFALIGLIYHYLKAPKDAFVLTLAFIFTGIAIVVYLNQKPIEPRERDYAYAGSFYFFAMWISFGVYAIIDFLKTKVKIQNAQIRIGVAGALGVTVPLILAIEGWDDHDRSGKTTARDLAMNYLMSCEKNGIIFTQGDNDTFPLWYMQEVEGYRTDVRVCNLSLLGTDWHTNQMKMKAYDSDPLPIGFSEDQIVNCSGNCADGPTDVMYFIDQLWLMYFESEIKPENFRKIIDLRIENLREENNTALATEDLNEVIETINQMDLKRNFFNGTTNLGDSIVRVFEMGKSYPDVYRALFNFGNTWSTVDLSKGMKLVEHEDDFFFKINIDQRDEAMEGPFSIFPSTKAKLKVNKRNAVSAKIITEDEMIDCPDDILLNLPSGIGKADIIMLNVIANFDWKRGIYLSGINERDHPVMGSLAPYMKETGLAYEFSPLGGGVNYEKYYQNLMKNYQYGDMKNKNVVTDYYARRQVNQMRTRFLNLSMRYLNMKDSSKALNLINRAIEKIPLDVVLGFGDQVYPQSSGIYFVHKETGSNKFISSGSVGAKITTPIPIDPKLVGQNNRVDINLLKQTDRNFDRALFEKSQNGNFYAVANQRHMSNRVWLFFNLYVELNENKRAKKVLSTLLPQYESVIKFFSSSDLETLTFAGPANKNADYLLSALNAIHEMHQTASDKKESAEKEMNQINETLKNMTDSLVDNTSIKSRKIMLEKTIGELNKLTLPLEKSLTASYKKLDGLFALRKDVENEILSAETTKIKFKIDQLRVIYGFN